MTLVSCQWCSCFNKNVHQILAIKTQLQVQCLSLPCSVNRTIFSNRLHAGSRHSFYRNGQAKNLVNESVSLKYNREEYDKGRRRNINVKKAESVHLMRSEKRKHTARSEWPTAPKHWRYIVELLHAWLNQVNDIYSEHRRCLVCRLFSWKKWRCAIIA